MEKFISAFGKSVASILTPGMLWIFIKSIVITFIALAIFIGLIIYSADYATSFLGYYKHFSFFLTWFAGLGAWLISWFLFPAIMPVIVSFFDDSIVKNIEKDSYPPAVQGDSWPFWQELRHDIGFAIKAIFLNILVLPLYILIPFASVFIFYALNGYLLGNEFYMTVARRHYDYKKAKDVRKANVGAVFVGGIMITFLATIPIINLVSPFWGVALMTHLFHSNFKSALNS